MKYGFIGCGNMGGALALALSKTTKDILLSDIDPEKARNLAEKLGVKSGTNHEVVKNCERIFFGVKPQVMADMISGIKADLKDKNTVIITMAAGIKTESIEKEIGIKLPIIRIMPNTPVMVESGMILYCTNGLVEDSTAKSFVNDMQFAGMLDEIDETLMDAGCSLSGCGPAFMYMFALSLAKGAEKCGIPKEKAIKYAAQTMLGSAQMLLKSGTDPETLIKNVCSPGGSTIEGVKSLESSNIYEMGEEAVKAAYKRNIELGKN